MIELLIEYFKNKDSLQKIVVLEKIKTYIRSKQENVFYIKCPVCSKEFKSLYVGQLLSQLLKHFENEHKSLVES